eukprot:1729933-Prymnesium_polylepis.2
MKADVRSAPRVCGAVVSGVGALCECVMGSVLSCTAKVEDKSRLSVAKNGAATAAMAMMAAIPTTAHAHERRQLSLVQRSTVFELQGRSWAVRTCVT